MITDPTAILVILAVVVWGALWLERRARLFRSLGAALVGILIGMLLSNTGLLPGTSPTYDLLSSTGVNLAVALILLGVDVRSILDAGPRMLIAFALGAAGTTVGAVVGALAFAGAVGPEAWKLAGQFTGTYIGGGMNFAALGRALDTSADMFSAAVAADVGLTAFWMATCLAVPVLLGRRAVPLATAEERAAAADDATDTDRARAPLAAPPRPDQVSPTLERSLTSSVDPIGIGELAALVAIATGSVWLAGRLEAWLPFLPLVLWLTTIALAAAQVPAIRRLAGGAMLGNYLLLLFLAANGAQSVIANIFRVGASVFFFAATTLIVHGLVLFGAGRLLGIDLGTLAVASQANVGGPASAVALASARGYADRLLPGIAVGLLGYAVGNYVGWGVALAMRALLVP